MADESTGLAEYEEAAWKIRDSIVVLLDKLVESIPTGDDVLAEFRSAVLRNADSRPYIETMKGVLCVQIYDFDSNDLAYNKPLGDMLKDFIDATDFDEPGCYTLDDMQAEIEKLADIVREAKAAKPAAPR